MKIKLVFFGVLVDVTGKSEIDLFTEDLKDVALLNSYLSSNYPLLTNHQYKIAVNQEIAGNEQLLYDGDEVALLPPFAGG